MSKYIDVECLKVEIERLKQENEISDEKEYAQYELDVACGYDMACEEILSFITSLQQEQPADEDDGKFVKISVRKEVAEQFQKLGDVILAGQSSFIRAMYQQEQPEVDLDLEARIEVEVEKMVGTDYFKQLLAKSKFVIDVLLYTARHFAEWGAIHLNARKEE